MADEDLPLLPDSNTSGDNEHQRRGWELAKELLPKLWPCYLGYAN